MSSPSTGTPTGAPPDVARGHAGTPTVDGGVPGPAPQPPSAVPPPPMGAAQVEREFTVRARSQWRLILRRFTRHRLAMISLGVFIAVVLVSTLGAWLWKYSYTYESDNPADFNLGPSWGHPLGTDSNGADYFSLVLRGAQRSIEIAIFVAVVSTVVGSIYGAIAGYFRGLADSLMMRVVDLFLTVPVIAIAAMLGNKYGSKTSGWIYIAIILSALTWPYVSRIVRGTILSLREKEYIEAARALGATNRRIIFRHLIPNAMGPVIVTVTILVALAILTETALSYIGFGVKAPDTSLGLLVQIHEGDIGTPQQWLFFFPGIVIVLIALTVNFIGDGLRDAFDPQQTRVRA